MEKPLGPTVLFDKSFIQSLSLDESVWFDYFFVSNICPIFYAETLADLSKDFKNNRTPEGAVSAIAAKVPQMRGGPCVHHQTLCFQNLIGNTVPLTGQIPMSGGYPVRDRDGIGIIFKQSPESRAFHRWQRGQFRELEREFAADWRAELCFTNLKGANATLAKLGFPTSQCKNLREAAVISKSMVDQDSLDFIKINALCSFQKINSKNRDRILARWRSNGCENIRTYAPYAAHVLEVDLFFYLALASSLISDDRPSNRIDIAYLYYLPFTDIFVSSDKLHRNATEAVSFPCKFVWGQELKSDLASINHYYSEISDDEKLKGLPSFANYPPETSSSFVKSLWDHYREAPHTEPSQHTKKIVTANDDKKLVEHLSGLQRAPQIYGPVEMQSLTDPQSISIERLISAKKGSWWQISKSVAEKNRSGG